MATQVRVVLTSDRYRDVGFDVEESVLTGFPELDVEIVPASTPDEAALLHAAEGADAILTSSTDPVRRELIAQLPSLRVIGRYAVGVDNIDLDAATEHGIVVTHFPDYCTFEVADHATALILTLNRRVVQADRNIRNGAWLRHSVNTPAILGGTVPPLRELTLGIIGFGRIGQAVLSRTKPFGFRQLVSDPYISPESAAAGGAELVSMNELLAQSDIVTLHCPLTPETRGMIGARELGLMKPSALIVNTARGPIIDLHALHDALASDRLGGAALDVVDPEPLPMLSPLYDLPNVVLTPHSAYYSERSLHVIRRETFVEVMTALAGRTPRVVANPAVLDALVLA